MRYKRQIQREERGRGKRITFFKYQNQYGEKKDILLRRHDRKKQPTEHRISWTRLK